MTVVRETFKFEVQVLLLPVTGTHNTDAGPGRTIAQLKRRLGGTPTTRTVRGGEGLRVTESSEVAAAAVALSVKRPCQRLRLRLTAKGPGSGAQGRDSEDHSETLRILLYGLLRPTCLNAAPAYVQRRGV